MDIELLKSLAEAKGSLTFECESAEEEEEELPPKQAAKLRVYNDRIQIRTPIELSKAPEEPLRHWRSLEKIQKVFFQTVKRFVAPVADATSYRPVLKNVYFWCDGHNIAAMASDGFRLHSVKAPEPGASVQMAIPARILKNLPASDWYVSVSSDKTLCLHTDMKYWREGLACRVNVGFGDVWTNEAEATIDRLKGFFNPGTLPEFQVVFNAPDLLDRLAVVPLTTSNALKLSYLSPYTWTYLSKDMVQGELQVSGEFSAKTRVKSPVKKPELGITYSLCDVGDSEHPRIQKLDSTPRIGLNVNLLREALRMYPGEVTMDLIDQTTAVRIWDAQGESEAVVMPMFLDWSKDE